MMTDGLDPDELEQFDRVIMPPKRSIAVLGLQLANTFDGLEKRIRELEAENARLCTENRKYHDFIWHVEDIAIQGTLLDDKLWALEEIARQCADKYQTRKQSQPTASMED